MANIVKRGPGGRFLAVKRGARRGPQRMPRGARRGASAVARGAKRIYQSQAVRRVARRSAAVAGRGIQATAKAMLPAGVAGYAYREAEQYLVKQISEGKLSFLVSKNSDREKAAAETARNIALALAVLGVIGGAKIKQQQIRDAAVAWVAVSGYKLNTSKD